MEKGIEKLDKWQKAMVNVEGTVGGELAIALYQNTYINKREIAVVARFVNQFLFGKPLVNAKESPILNKVDALINNELSALNLDNLMDIFIALPIDQWKQWAKDVKILTSLDFEEEGAVNYRGVIVEREFNGDNLDSIMVTVRRRVS